MALKAVVDSLDDIPTEIHGEYIERNGKYELQVEGMKTQADLDRISQALTKERNDHKGLQQRVSLLGDKKIEDVVTILDRVPELEAAAAGKLDDKAIDQMVETRIKTRLAPIERERDQLKTQVADLGGKVGDYEKKDKKRTIHDKVRAAAVKVKLMPEAVDDALMLADRHFEVEEGTGKAITRDGVGVTPGLEAEAWLTDLKDKRPHWWGASSGGGARGSGGGNNGTVNPFTAENWNMTEQGNLVKNDRAKAEQLAKAAGTSIGGPKPAAKK